MKVLSEQTIHFLSFLLYTMLTFSVSNILRLCCLRLMYIILKKHMYSWYCNGFVIFFYASLGIVNL